MMVCSQVCREYQRGNCSRGETDCRFAHPADSTMIDPSDNTVTVCMDYIKGRCSRDKCKYFHPPAHLQAKIKAAQHQVNQATAAAAMVSEFSPTRSAFINAYIFFISILAYTFKGSLKLFMDVVMSSSVSLHLQSQFIIVCYVSVKVLYVISSFCPAEGKVLLMQ